MKLCNILEIKSRIFVICTGKLKLNEYGTMVSESHIVSTFRWKKKLKEEPFFFCWAEEHYSILYRIIGNLLDSFEVPLSTVL